MANWSTALRQSCGFNGDLEEEDVWSSVNEREDSSSDFIIRKSTDYYYSSSPSSSWRLPTAPKRIPKSISKRTHETQMENRSSAPVEIPDWSKIYGKMDSSTDDRFCVKNDNRKHYSVVEDDNDDEDDDMVPPHEWIAQKLARSQISSFSVCEGVGRTLKGRDLSKVRNAILTKTGFLE